MGERRQRKFRHRLRCYFRQRNFDHHFRDFLAHFRTEFLADFHHYFDGLHPDTGFGGH